MSYKLSEKIKPDSQTEEDTNRRGNLVQMEITQGERQTNKNRMFYKWSIQRPEKDR